MRRPENIATPLVVDLPAVLENLPRFIAPVMTLARDSGCSAERCADLELALEEALANICNHAYPQKKGYVRVSCRMESGALVVGIEDGGSAFSVLAAAAPDLTSELSDRKIGGLGVHLIRTLMDDVRYRREEGRNVLELVVMLGSAGVGR